MQITKFEQSGFIIESDNGYKLAVDIGAYTPVEKITGLKPEAMLVSHIHGDHFSDEHIKALEPAVLYLNQECQEALGEDELTAEIETIAAGDSVTINDATVTVFEVDHGPNTKMVPKENFGFLIEVDNQKIYFAGDMFYLSGLDVSSLEVDVALIPVGTFYTFGPEEALAFVKQFKKVGKVIPMHYEKAEETKQQFIDLATVGGINVELGVNLG